MADAETGSGADQRETEQLRVAFDFQEEIGVGGFEVLEAGVGVGLGFHIEQGGEAEFVDEAFDFAGGHGLAGEVDELDDGAALFEEALRGSGGLGVFQAEDLDVQQSQLEHSVE